MYPLNSDSHHENARDSEDNDPILPFDLAAHTIEQVKSEVLPKKLDILLQHGKNIATAIQTKDHVKGKQEVLKGALVAKQIEGELANLEKLKQRLRPSDHQAFDNMTTTVIRKARKTLRDFYEIKQSQSTFETNYTEEEEVSLVNASQFQIVKHDYELQEAEAYAQEFEKLHEDCRDVHDTYRELSKMVAESGELIDQVEDNLVSTETHVTIAEKSLAYCAKKKLAFYPLIGAVVGACVGGPIGLVVGAKVAAVAAIGGGVIGFSGMRVIKKQQLQELNNVEYKQIKPKDP